MFHATLKMTSYPDSMQIRQDQVILLNIDKCLLKINILMLLNGGKMKIGNVHQLKIIIYFNDNKWILLLSQHIKDMVI